MMFSIIAVLGLGPLKNDSLKIRQKYWIYNEVAQLVWLQTKPNSLEDFFIEPFNITPLELSNCLDSIRTHKYLI